MRFEYNGRIYCPANLEKKLAKMGITMSDIKILEDSKKLNSEYPFGTTEYFEQHGWYFVGLLNPKRCEVVPPSKIHEYTSCFYTRDHDKYVEWYKMN